MSAEPSPLSVRRATERDAPAIVALLGETMGEGGSRGAWSEAYWRWKHIDNPFGTSPVLVAEADGRIVALRAFMRWTWQAGGEERTAVRAVDTVTHVGWRGQGLFRRLTMQLVAEMAAEGVGFVFNTPNAQSGPGYLSMGWQAVGRVPVWVRPLRPLGIARALAGRRSPAAAGALDLAPAEALADHPGVARLFEPPADDPRLRTVSSPAFLRWRYAAVPGLAYHAAFDLDGPRPAALVGRVRERRGLRELSLADLLLPPGSEPTARVLLRDVLRRSGADYAVAVAASGTPGARTLRRAGFVPVRALGPLLTVRALADPALVPARWTAWAPTLGDLELF